ncbi:MAG: acetate/propionate family kinase [Bradyrhizobium sp.]|uniref:acetate/propionate family kinase n=1 Tax=Bradyrhizobium sp. TaxID=376 RepID=UPI0029A0F637|nr:acetate/propionate family kinase [Bradyrhizobium sp.]MDX3967157.1 acetate/propionate family kinase [Bradyrhizobium sp.]
MSEALLVLNAGSSSIKFSLFPAGRRPDRDDLLCEGACEGIGHRVSLSARDGAGRPLIAEDLQGRPTHEDALASILEWLGNRFPDHPPTAAGHRVVHGGSAYSAPVLLDGDVITELRRLIPLAPSHQPHNLAAIAALAKLHPDLPQVGCFDTAFHHTQPPVATEYALPRRLTEEGVRRYGFHGLSYEYIASVLPGVIGAPTAQGRVVVAHLGHGASMCALKAGRSIATTMGFTALDGLPMGRRCGSLDPGVILYLMEQKGMTASAISDLLYHSSGLLGVSGISDDMKALLESARPQAVEAIELFVYRISRELGSLVAALGGLDALVFTAGIGEHAPEIRRSVCEQAAWLGLEFDATANRNGGPHITRQGSRISAWVIPTDEDLMIARHTRRLLDERQVRSEKAAQKAGA